MSSNTDTNISNNTNSNVSTNTNTPNTQELKKVKNPPKIQHAQKCPYCNKYLLGDQAITTYSGTNDDFVDWLVHEECQT